jgi:hypothetical protein
MKSGFLQQKFFCDVYKVTYFCSAFKIKHHEPEPAKYVHAQEQKNSRGKQALVSAQWSRSQTLLPEGDSLPG